MTPPRLSRLEWLALGAIVLGAFAFRFVNVGERPMHSDEANQAVKLGHLLDGNGYRFDPADHHGPTLYYFAALVAKLRGESSLAALTEPTVRLTTVIFGTLAVPLIYALIRPRGRIAAVAAALFVTCSPPAVYYSRYFIQESLLPAFFLSALVCGREWIRSGRRRWAISMGVAGGCLVATKMSAFVFGGLAVVAAFWLWPRNASLPSPARKDGVLAVAAAFFVAVLFYSSFGAHLPGVAAAGQSIATMLGRATTGESGHEKPVWYYLGLFLFRRSHGLVWDQTLFLLLALAGVVIASRSIWRTGKLMAFVAVGALLILSLTPYKTPWQIVSVIPLLAMLAATAVGSMRAPAAIPFIAAVTLLLSWQSWQAAYFRPADQVNPYAYAHASPDVMRVAALAREAPPGVIKVVAEEYWPLPWYLRKRPEVGYWTTPPVDCDGTVVFADLVNADAVRAKLRGDYRSQYVGLRPGVILEVFVRDDDRRP